MTIYKNNNPKNPEVPEFVRVLKRNDSKVYITAPANRESIAVLRSYVQFVINTETFDKQYTEVTPEEKQATLDGELYYQDKAIHSISVEKKVAKAPKARTPKNKAI